MLFQGLCTIFLHSHYPWSAAPRQEGVARWELVPSLMKQVTASEEMTSSCPKGCLNWVLRKKFFSEGVVRIWNRLSRAAVESPFLKMFKIHVDVAPVDRVQWWTQWFWLMVGLHESSFPTLMTLWFCYSMVNHGLSVPPLALTGRNPFVLWCREQDVVLIQKCWKSVSVLWLTARLGQNTSGGRKKFFKNPIFSLKWILGAERFWKKRGNPSLGI